MRQIFHIDHLHPKSNFEKKRLKNLSFLTLDKELMEFYVNPKHWNSIANLHLLNHSQNLVKSDRPLVEWVEDKEITLTKESLLLDKAPLDFSEFKEFYTERRDALKTRLTGKVFMTTVLSNETTIDDSDEEVVEEPIL